MGFESSCHCGVKKKRIPLDAPSRVTARTNNANIITYGNSARKYEHFPELLTPRDMIKNTITHAPNKHNAKRQLGSPMKLKAKDYALKIVDIRTRKRVQISNILLTNPVRNVKRLI